MADEVPDPDGSVEVPVPEIDDVEEARRRRLRVEVFGEVLPETTRDERGDGAPEGHGRDEWLRRNVPPHHG